MQWSTQGESEGQKRALLASALAKEESLLRDLDAERAARQERIGALRGELALLEGDGQLPVEQPVLVPATPPGSSAAKVALFQSLFRGRTDVFPKLWVNPRTGKKGYSPACGNEWVRGICEKPRVKCGECPNQAFLPAFPSRTRSSSITSRAAT